MEKNRIGLHAGEVWRVLHENGKLSMFELCHKLDLTFEEVALAIGWLARENKLFIVRRENMLYASVDGNIEFSFG